MRRTVIHYVDTTDFGGAERALLHLLVGLDPARWRPVLFHPDEPGLSVLIESATAADVPTRIVPRMRGLRSVTKMPNFHRLVAAERPAVFHVHLNWPLAGSAGLLAAAFGRVPAIVATAQLVSPLPSALTLPLQRRFVTRAVDRYLAVSHDAAARLASVLRIPRHRIDVVHNAVPVPPDAARARRSRERRRPLVVALARLTPQKGIPYLLRAAAQLPDVDFAIAGDGPDRTSLESQTRRLGIEDRVTFLGFVRDTAALLNEADLVVLPSVLEGLPLAILEAMAAGKAVVATAIGGTDEAVIHGETGLLVRPEDPAQLAEAIRTLVDDPALARRLGAGGRERVSRDFSAERMVEAVSRVYGVLLDQRPRTLR